MDETRMSSKFRAGAVYNSGMRNILIHEPTPRWTAILERTLSLRDGNTIAWRPHAIDLAEDIRATPDSLIIIACPPHPDSLDLVSSLTQSGTSKILCIVDDEDFGWECLARELGATAILPATVEQKRLLESVVALL